MEIIFAGDSHYGLGGYKSLCEYFDKIYLIKENPSDILNNIRNCDEVINEFNSVDCKHVFLCGYGRLITAEMLEKKQYINVHGALLPKYRGMHSTFYAIMNGEKELGITFHLLSEYMDAGDILAQFSFPYEGQIVQEINDKIDELVREHAGHVLSDYLTGNIVPTPQDESKALFSAKRNLEDCLVDFNMSNLMLERFFKALTPNYPYPMLSIRGKKYEILPGWEIIRRDYYGPIGRGVYFDSKGMWIKTKEGFLIVKEVKSREDGTIAELKDIVPIGYRFNSNL